NKKVLNCLYKNPEAIFKLICFPWAGGSSIHFAKWGQDTQDSLEETGFHHVDQVGLQLLTSSDLPASACQSAGITGVSHRAWPICLIFHCLYVFTCASPPPVHTVRLPGRESRIGEPMATDIYQIIDEITCAMLPVIQGKPFAFFGHSMGGYMAFKTALHLKEKHNLEPLHLFLSSAFSPHSKVHIEIPKDGGLSEEQICRYLVDLGGTPMNFVEDKELVQQCMPTMMVDANIISKCISESPSKTILSCDLTCFFGSEDIDLVKDTEGWKNVSTGSVSFHKLPGNHFYFKNPANEKFIKNYITKCLEVSSLTDF
uniref:S-acyl fatty acid synthase thioesterase, medium chain n=1 Tax=Cebus imitator TaxID=2715852 RepID=A0A2K5PUZ5_CEBIM